MGGRDVDLMPIILTPCPYDPITMQARGPHAVSVQSISNYTL